MGEPFLAERNKKRTLSISYSLKHEIVNSRCPTSKLTTNYDSSNNSKWKSIYHCGLLEVFVLVRKSSYTFSKPLRALICVRSVQRVAGAMFVWMIRRDCCTGPKYDATYFDQFQPCRYLPRPQSATETCKITLCTNYAQFSPEINCCE